MSSSTPDASQPTRIVLVDDHPIVRSGLRSLLETVPGVVVVGEAENGAGAVKLVREQAPHVVIMDVQMPGMDGIEATRRIVADRPSTGVLMLTMFEDDASVFAAVRAGARGYILKGAAPVEVAQAIQAVRAGQVVFGAALAARIAEYFSTASAARPAAFRQLSTREHEVLVLMAASVSNGAIARRLDISAKTVANHVSNIVTKLRATDRADAIAQARNAGL
jgi:DNA-binding NarL/FixJ family response regulator